MDQEHRENLLAKPGEWGKLIVSVEIGIIELRDIEGMSADKGNMANR